jgi:hypothetical protein
MLLSQEALSVSSSSRTLKFQGDVQGHTVIVLVDWGSSHSFINEKLAGLSVLIRPIRVQVANGQVIQCISELKQTTWAMKGNNFVSDLKVLPLPYYDVVVGIDWLELHSPMRVD